MPRPTRDASIIIQGIRFDPVNAEVGNSHISIPLEKHEVKWLELTFKPQLPLVPSHDLMNGLYGTGRGAKNAFRAAMKRLRQRLLRIGLNIWGGDQRGYRVVITDPKIEHPVIKIGLWTFGEPTNDLNEPITSAFRLALGTISTRKLSYSIELIEHNALVWSRDAVKAGLKAFASAGVAAIVGPMDSRAAYLLLDSKLLDHFKLGVLSPSASSAMLCHDRLSSDYFFRCRSSDRPLLKELRRWIHREHPQTEVLPLVQEGRPGEVLSFGEQNWEVFRQLPDGDRMPFMSTVYYPEGDAMSVVRRWQQTLQDRKPKVIVAFGYGAELAPLCALAQAHDKEKGNGTDRPACIYTIEPRRECFVNPARSRVPVPPIPIIGLRAVVEATFQIGGGFSTKIRGIKQEWEAACHGNPLRRWAYRNALYGHDAAYILIAALERALGRKFISRRTLPQAIVEELASRIANEDTLLSNGVFSADRELFSPVRCVHLTEKMIFEDFWPPETEVIPEEVLGNVAAGPG